MTRVSVITPCRNEERFIGGCLDSILANVFPKDELEVLVIDGRSSDRTREIVEGYGQKHPFIRLMENPGRVQTLATNIGIRASKGDVIVRMDAHAEYPRDFIARSVGWLQRSGADCVGGLWVTRAADSSTKAGSIALALSHPFGVGNAYYRVGVKEPQYVDTVPFGCYKKEVFNKVGLFNENLDRTDDIEFNLRLRRAGGKILLVPEIFSYYYARANFRGLAEQGFGNGFWILYSLRFVRLPFSLRHLVPFFFVSFLVFPLLASLAYPPFIYLFVSVLGLHSCLNFLFSGRLAFRHGLKYFPFLLVTFLTLHLSYGLGSLWGIAKLVVSCSTGKNQT